MIDQPERRRLEERLWQVKEALERIAQMPVESRDYDRWQKLTSEESELMKALDKGGKV